MECERCQRLIADAAGREVPTAVAAHVVRCSACAAVLADEQLVRAVLNGMALPASPLGGDLQRLAAFAAVRDAERRARQRRARRHLERGLVLAILCLLGMWWVLRQRPAGGMTSIYVLPLGLGIATWAWLEVIGRRLAEEGATLFAQIGVGIGRAAVGLALVVAVVDPSRLADLPYAMTRMAGGPAEAHGAVVEAELVCAALVDGRLRLARASEGCRRHEIAVALDGQSGDAAGPVDLGGLAIRFGTATIPAGEWGTSVALSPPMADVNYRILFSPHSISQPITADDACHLLGAAAASTDRFSIDLRRCWFEGVDVPTPRVTNDVTVDWVVIGGR